MSQTERMPTPDPDGDNNESFEALVHEINQIKVDPEQLNEDELTLETHQYILDLKRQGLILAADALFQDPDGQDYQDSKPLLEEYMTAFNNLINSVTLDDKDQDSSYGQEALDQLLEEKVKKYVNEQNYVADIINETARLSIINKITTDNVTAQFIIGEAKMSAENAKQITTKMVTDIQLAKLNEYLVALSQIAHERIANDPETARKAKLEELRKQALSIGKTALGTAIGVSAALAVQQIFKRR